MAQKVAIIKQPNYELESLERSIRQSIDLCGFDLASVACKKVLLKPNMLGAYPPSKAVTTNPDFVYVTAKIFKKAGAKVSVGDSANGVHAPKKTLDITGIREAIERADVSPISFEASGAENRDGLMISKAPLNADFVINLPKFKTHSLTVLTAAVKNLYGCINGMQKSELHRRFSDLKEFSKMLVKIAETVQPNLNIVDAITAMEGNGPSGGKLRQIGCIISGMNMYSVDAICSKLVRLNPVEVDTLRIAKELKLWNDCEEIQIVGNSLEELSPENFELPSTYIKKQRDSWFFNFIMKRIWSNVSGHPAINKKSCVKCYLCAKACPVQVMSCNKGFPPKIDKSKCIQCFCCHEVCPHKAIDIKHSFLIRIGKLVAKKRTR